MPSPTESAAAAVGNPIRGSANDGRSIVVGDPNEAADCKSSGLHPIWAPGTPTRIGWVRAALDHDLQDRDLQSARPLRLDQRAVQAQAVI